MKTMWFAAFFAFFPLFFVALWMFVCFVISLFGWRTLALHFRADSKPEGRNFPMQSLEMGLSHYNGCLSMVVAEKGLYLRPWIMFRAWHPPLLVPWNACGAPQFRKVWWVNQCLIPVQIPDKQSIPMIFSSAIGELMASRIEAAKLAPDASPWSDNALH